MYMFAGYKFKDEGLYNLARTHTSYANEHRKTHQDSNQRLEFLGDSVLSIIVSDYIYTNYPDLPEGFLTKLRAAVVCEESLHEIAVKLELGKELLLGHGEENMGGRTRPSILADLVEAMLGAVYMDSGLECARKVFMPLIEDKIKNTADCAGKKDYKTTLQELVQQERGKHAVYSIIDEKGPDHMKEYRAKVSVGSLQASGTGRTKKAAEQMAAKNIISKLGGKSV